MPEKKNEEAAEETKKTTTYPSEEHEGVDVQDLGNGIYLIEEHISATHSLLRACWAGSTAGRFIRRAGDIDSRAKARRELERLQKLFRLLDASVQELLEGDEKGYQQSLEEQEVQA